VRRIVSHWPVTFSGWIVLIAAGGLFGAGRFWWRDEVANALSLLLAATFAGQAILLAVSGLCSYSASSSSPAMRDADPDGTEQLTGWRLETVAWPVRLGLCLLELEWDGTDAAPLGLLAPPRLSGDRGEISAILPRRGEYRIATRGSLQDALGLFRTSIPLPHFAPLVVLPPRSELSLDCLPPVRSHGDALTPDGRPIGDWIDIKRAEPQTPRRLILWKLTAKTGSLETMRRAPETTGVSDFQSGLFLCVSDKDEPAASLLRSVLERHWFDEQLLGRDWVYADSTQPRELLGRGSAVQAALARLARSGNKSSFLPNHGQTFDEFLAACRHRSLNRILVFCGDAPIPAWQREIAHKDAIEFCFFRVSDKTDGRFRLVDRIGQSSWYELRSLQ